MKPNVEIWGAKDTKHFYRWSKESNGFIWESGDQPAWGKQKQHHIQNKPQNGQKERNLSQYFFSMSDILHCISLRNQASTAPGGFVQPLGSAGTRWLWSWSPRSGGGWDGVKGWVWYELFGGKVWLEEKVSRFCEFCGCFWAFWMFNFRVRIW